ncbi:protease inhibitor 1-like isoform X3 [Paroedura picta]|uniref:protease inhibitor 1-like isoform X3 n=1 Tax=Paroedura picta TaxID=143630 RepID=UPI004056FBFD
MAARDLPVLLLLVVGLLAIWAEMPSAAEAKGICSLPPYPGPCLALIRRWYFDWKTRRCEEFDYGGCRGNANNFKTRRECQLACGGKMLAAQAQSRMGTAHTRIPRQKGSLWGEQQKGGAPQRQLPAPGGHRD